jgi:hypothetical protein
MASHHLGSPRSSARAANSSASRVSGTSSAEVSSVCPSMIGNADTAAPIAAST